jgi:hypothetical protein
MYSLDSSIIHDQAHTEATQSRLVQGPNIPILLLPVLGHLSRSSEVNKGLDSNISGAES